MKLTAQFDATEMIESMTDKEVIALIKLACENLMDPGSIQKVREIVNSPLLDD